MAELIKLLKELDRIAHDCSRDNWGGYGEERVKQEALNEVEGILDKFPNEIIGNPDDIGASPDGSIYLEWKSDYRYLLLRLSGTGIVHCFCRLNNESPLEIIKKNISPSVLDEAIIKRMNDFSKESL